ncbi:hypothetical protein LTR10_004357 [Elasticomyces elasticus]|nr:hypothetical protein LTR10_004357 [Elasticomyces elasticus]KAK4976676.1 hypothetical protein LTR42_002719 [Elasticomyces elasticus]
MASEQIPAGTPGFLRLPAELRNIIYEYCNSMNGVAGPTRSRHPPVSSESEALLRDVFGATAPSPQKFRFTALAQTCRTLRQDAFAFFLADVVLVLDVDPSSLETTMREVKEIPAHVLSKIDTMFIAGQKAAWHFIIINGGVFIGKLAMNEKERDEQAWASTHRRCNQAVGCAYNWRLPRAVARLQSFHHARTTEILTEEQQKIALERLIEVIDGRAEVVERFRKEATVFGVATASILLVCIFYHTGDLAGDIASMVVLLAAIILLSNGNSAAEVLWKEEKPMHRENAIVRAVASTIIVCLRYRAGVVAGDITFMVVFLAIIALVSRLPGQRSDVRFPSM